MELFLSKQPPWARAVHRPGCPHPEPNKEDKEAPLPHIPSGSCCYLPVFWPWATLQHSSLPPCPTKAAQARQQPALCSLDKLLLGAVKAMEEGWGTASLLSWSRASCVHSASKTPSCWVCVLKKKKAVQWRNATINKQVQYDCLGGYFTGYAPLLNTFPLYGDEGCKPVWEKSSTHKLMPPSASERFAFCSFLTLCLGTLCSHKTRDSFCVTGWPWWQTRFLISSFLNIFCC